MIVKNVKWSKGVRAITLSITLATLILLAAAGVFAWQGEAEWAGILALPGGLLAASEIVCFAYGPFKVSLSGSALTVKRGMGKKTFELSHIVDAGAYKLGNDYRVCGVGGLFGWVGHFRRSRFGSYFAYVGDFEQAFFIVLDSGKRYVLSCEGREELLGLLTQYNVPAQIPAETVSGRNK